MSNNLLMLLEMIEEVLEERSQSAQELFEKYAKLHTKIPKMLVEENGDSIKVEQVFEKNSKKEPLPHRAIYKLKSFTSRADLAEKIKQSLELPEAALPVYDSSGNQIIGYKLKSGRSIVFSFVLKPQRGFNMAEQMENVIARASGNESAKFTNNDSLNKEVQRMRSAAEQIPGKPLTKLKNQKLPEDGLYKKYGATSGVPKTDLIGREGKNKYSVKKGGGAQFVSAQGPESAALWHIAAAKAAVDALDETLVTKSLKLVPAYIMDNFDYEQFKGIKDFSPDDKKEIYEKVGNLLFKDILKRMGINKDKFKEAFVKEGISGERKFNGGPGTANQVLTWNSDPEKPAIEPIVDVDQYITNNKDKIQLRVSDRGGKRGGSIRGDILSTPVKNESIVIEVVDDAEEKIQAEIDKFIKSNNITPDQMKKILQKIGPIIKEQAQRRAAGAAVAVPPPKGIRNIDYLADQAVEMLKQIDQAIEKGAEFAFKKMNDFADETADTVSMLATGGVPTAVAALANEIDSVVLAKFNQLANYPVLFLDYLRSYEGEDVDMIPFYEGLPVEFGDTEEPDEEIPMEGT